MRSLFLKIFLSFWLAQALFLVLATLVTLAIRQQAESAWEAEQAQILSQTVQTYETGGQAALAQYLDRVRQSQGVRAYLLDENDQELSGRRSRDWAKDGEHRRPRSSRGGFLGWMAARPQRQSITSASGHRYTLVMFPPPHGPFGDLGIHGLGIFIAILSSGLVCYLLARYLTSPVVRLRAATQKLAAGDLTARAGVPPPGRHDESGDQAMKKVSIRLQELIREIAQDAEFEAQSRKCRVDVTKVDDCMVIGDPSLLRSAIENVVRNAIQYTREGTDVQIGLECRQGTYGTEAVIKISDSGPGVPAEALDKLFRPFYRIDDARGRQTGGVGLGLAIAERAVRLHGGTIQASNRSEGGLMIEIRLPALPAKNENG